MAAMNENYGGFWIRFLAYVVDSLIVVIAFFLIVTLLGVMGLELISHELILLAMGLLYYAFMQSSARQATYGKSLVGLKVTGLAGERITLARALAREVAKIISAMTLLLGFIIAGFTKRKQALHDFVASTYVVRTEPGHVMAAVAVALVALFAPVIVVLFFGAGLVAGLAGGIAGALMSGPEIVMQTPKPPAAPSPPVAKPQVIAAKPVLVSAPAPVAAPVVMAQAPQAAKPEPAKPEPAKPVAMDPVKEAPKPVAKKQRAKPAARELAREAAIGTAPAAAATPAAAETPAAAPPKPMAAPVQMAAAPTTAGTMRFNDLVTAVLYRDAGAVNDLLAFGKWPDKGDSRGMTPLMLAALLGDAPIAEALLKAGANPNRAGPGGDTAMTIARERKDSGMVGLLRQHGAR